MLCVLSVAVSGSKRTGGIPRPGSRLQDGWASTIAGRHLACLSLAMLEERVARDWERVLLLEFCHLDHFSLGALAGHRQRQRQRHHVE